MVWARPQNTCTACFETWLEITKVHGM